MDNLLLEIACLKKEQDTILSMLKEQEALIKVSQAKLATESAVSSVKGKSWFYSIFEAYTSSPEFAYIAPKLVTGAVVIVSCAGGYYLVTYMVGQTALGKLVCSIGGGFSYVKAVLQATPEAISKTTETVIKSTSDNLAQAGANTLNLMTKLMEKDTIVKIKPTNDWLFDVRQSSDPQFGELFIKYKHDGSDYIAFSEFFVKYAQYIQDKLAENATPLITNDVLASIAEASKNLFT